MFDLKAKLLAQGLVTKEQVEKISSQKNGVLPADNFLIKDRQKTLNHLKTEAKSEQYVIIRRWVDLNRLDKEAHASLDCEKFFFTANDNQISWLTLKKEVIDEIKKGNAALIAYMSNHGLTHAVVPRDIAEDVKEVFPEWLRVLNDKAAS